MRWLAIWAIGLFAGLPSLAQSNTDTLFFKSGNKIIGEIKGMDRGVLTMETNYSDKDFAIEWIHLASIRSSGTFLITLRSGQRITGTLFSENLNDSARIEGTDLKGRLLAPQVVSLDQIVYLKGVKDKFISRLRATIDAGLNLTKANNLRQWNAKASVGYTGDHINFDSYVQILQSIQDSIAKTRRTDAGVGFQYFLANDWYMGAGLNFLSNTEQALKLRTTGKLGVGNFIIHTNKQYWSAGGGLNINSETFSNETSSRNSLEVFVGTELNLFDIGDLNLLSNLYLYRSVTESGRWRSDIKVDLKYDLPLDFYIKAGGTINYDNRPAIPGNETDYIFTFGLGWELD